MALTPQSAHAFGLHRYSPRSGVASRRFVRLALAMTFALGVLGLWSGVASAGVRGAPRCDSRCATTFAPPPVLMAADASIAIDPASAEGWGEGRERATLSTGDASNATGDSASNAGAILHQAEFPAPVDQHIAFWAAVLGRASVGHARGLDRPPRG